MWHLQLTDVFLHWLPAGSKFISCCEVKDIAFAVEQNSSRHVYENLFSWDFRPPFLHKPLLLFFCKPWHDPPFLDSVFTTGHNKILNTSGVNFHEQLKRMLDMKKSREEMHSNDPICLRMEINSVLSNSGWVTGLARRLDFPTAPSLHLKLTSYIKRPPIRS